MSDNTPDTKNSKKPLISWSEYLPVLIGLGFLVSVFYDYGFTKALGIDFSELPTSTSDHFRTGLIWLPAVFIMLVTVITIEAINKRIERGLSEEEILATSKNPGALKRHRDAPWKALPFVAIFVIFTQLCIAETINVFTLAIFSSIIWYSVFNWIFSIDRVSQRYSTSMRMFLLVALPVLSPAFGYGYDHAIEKRLDMTSNIEIHTSTAPLSRRGTALRTLDKGLLYLDPEGFVQFLTWSEIKGIKYTDKNTIPQGILYPNKLPQEE